ncbi:beta-1,4-n-acetylglucosaminyltransferase [Fusarium longipes]|uniref:UDP-N-acetylglucosamine transferase subunit ALG13 n=1 Tax=Fusarium longipes TaxID=694270 RepID=A0A395RVC3_9HYPO|nr:beta-1,4-n-acetylglucosaminyltransferase [Fusarium longipes]
MALSHFSRVCLVTVGATAGFKILIDSVLSPNFWKYIVSQGFTELHVQCGPDVVSASKQLSTIKDEVPPGLIVDIFDAKKNLMKEEMILCKDVEGKRQLGLVISHAGTGTILDAWKMGLPIVVVPNTQLLDDHQTEMAKHLSNEGYAIMSTGSTEDLKEAIHKVGLLWEENKTRWPPHKIPLQEPDRVRLWDLAPVEVAKEENATMVHD